MLELKRSTDLGKNIKTIAGKIYSFGQGGRFLFASVMTGKVSLQLIHISHIYRNMIRHPEPKYCFCLDICVCKKKLQSTTTFEIYVMLL